MTTLPDFGSHTVSGRDAQRRGLQIEALLTASIGTALIFYVGDRAYLQDLATLAIVYSFLALGMYLPLALGGQLSLAYNAYFAIGAYSVALFAGCGTLALWVSIPTGMAISAATAILLGLVTHRLSGFHLAVATVMFGIAVQTFLVHSDGVVGGPSGLGGIPRLSVFGFELGRGALVTIGIMMVWAVATMVACFRVSLAGIALRTQRESPVAAAASGVPSSMLRLLALSTGAAIASLAGILFALMNQFILPESFGTKIVFLVLFMPILGGMSTPWGAVLGASLVVALTLGFEFVRGPGALTFGVLSLFVLLVAPRGLIGLGVSCYGWMKLKLSSRAEKHG